MREVARFKVDISRHLGRRISNHEISAAALGLVPGDPAVVAELLRRHAPRIGVDPDAPPSPSRRLVASVPSPSAAGPDWSDPEGLPGSVRGAGLRGFALRSASPAAGGKRAVPGTPPPSGSGSKPEPRVGSGAPAPPPGRWPGSAAGPTPPR